MSEPKTGNPDDAPFLSMLPKTLALGKLEVRELPDGTYEWMIPFRRVVESPSERCPTRTPPENETAPGFRGCIDATRARR